MVPTAQLPPRTPDVVAAAVPSPSDAGTGDMAASIRSFKGFSADEQRFAFSILSEGAGFHLLMVVEGAGGEVKERFPLDGPEGIARAAAFLRAGGFTAQQGTLPAAAKDRTRVVVSGTKVKATVGDRVVYDGAPFKVVEGMGAPKSAKVDQVSPSGKRIAIRVEQTPVTEYGGIVTYVLADVEGAK
jgi:hypothetical protein